MKKNTKTKRTQYLKVQEEIKAPIKEKKIIEKKENKIVKEDKIEKEEPVVKKQKVIKNEPEKDGHKVIKKKIKKENYLKIVLIVLILIFSYTAIKTFHILYNEFKSKSIINEVMEENTKVIPISELIEKDENAEDTQQEEQYTYDFANLRDLNSDTVAWIEIPEIEFSYPVVHTNNNTYYMNHSFDKSKNINGWIFLNSLNNADFTDKNTVIYGHNSLFKPLRRYFDSKKKNKLYIYIYRDLEVQTYEVFSMYKTVSYDVLIVEPTMDEELIEERKNRSVYDFKVDVNNDDQILTISTCYNDKTEKIMTHAKRIS